MPTEGLPTRWSHLTLAAGPLDVAQDDGERVAARETLPHQ